MKRLGLSALLQAKSDEDILRSLSDIKVSQRVTFRGWGQGHCPSSWLLSAHS